ncbi:MAG: NAD-binding protein [Nautiliaceae bacterium]
MKVVLFGFDDFGERVSEFLSKRDVLVVVFDEEEEKRAKSKLFDVVRLIDITDDDIKKLDRFDVALCVLRDEDKNLFLSLTLKDLFPKIPIVAKVSNKDNEYKYKLAGVEKTINPYEVTANRIMTILKKPLTLKLVEEIIFNDNVLIFDDIQIPPNSFLDGKYIRDIYKEIKQKYNILIIAIVDKEMSENVQFVTKGINHKLDRDDILVIVGERDDILRFKKDLQGE